MNKILTTLLCLFAVSYLKAQPVNIDSLGKELDRAIAESHKYVEQKEQLINEFKSNLKKAKSAEEQFNLGYQLYDQYRSFMNDSAIYYIGECIQAAERDNNKNRADFCRARMAFQCSSSGLYKEAEDILRNIDYAAGDRQVKAEYMKSYVHLYSELAYYGKLRILTGEYRDRSEAMKQQLFETLDPQSDDYLQKKEEEFRAKNDFKNALAMSDKRLKEAEPGSHAFAIAAFYRYLDYTLTNDTTQQIYWLQQSALADVRNAIMDQGALWELANLLRQRGELTRAHNYIRFAYECANRFSTRLRNWQISPILSDIDNDYQQELNHANKNLSRAVIGACVLALFALMQLYYVNRQRKRLSKAKQQLSETNEQMAGLNAELKSVNGQLSDVNSLLSEANGQLKTLNDKLTAKNEQLAESNRVKEEYIGRFMRLCSLYIDKMDDLRKKVNKRVRNKEYEELYNMTRSQEFKEKELDELYQNFDTAFLHLFPDFVEQFNALLKPEEQVEQPQNNQLNTGLRIFALIRLGIEDSSKIAEFLHYSVNTIYNYRARIKNGALSDRENFERRVKEIGRTL